MRVLPTKWRRKPAGIDMERTYVTVTVCTHSYLLSANTGCSQRCSLTSSLDEFIGQYRMTSAGARSVSQSAVSTDQQRPDAVAVTLANTTLFSDIRSAVFLPARSYAIAVLISYGPVSVCLSVCLCLSVSHKSVFHRNVFMNRAGFDMKAFPDLLSTCTVL